MRATILALIAVSAGFQALGDDAVPQASPFVTEPVALEDLQWTHRPVIVFADTPNDPRFVQQMERLQERSAALAERDVVVLVDTDPNSGSDLRTKLRPRGFMLVLIGKDGQVKLRKPAPWDVRELTRVIDKMPLRQQEIRDAQRATQG